MTGGIRSKNTNILKAKKCAIVIGTPKNWLFYFILAYQFTENFITVSSEENEANKLPFRRKTRIPLTTIILSYLSPWKVSKACNANGKRTPPPPLHSTSAASQPMFPRKTKTAGRSNSRLWNFPRQIWHSAGYIFSLYRLVLTFLVTTWSCVIVLFIWLLFLCESSSHGTSCPLCD